MVEPNEEPQLNEVGIAQFVELKKSNSQENTRNLLDDDGQLLREGKVYDHFVCQQTNKEIGPLDEKPNCLELVEEPEQIELDGEQDNDAILDNVFMPAWIQRNFAWVTHEEELKRMSCSVIVHELKPEDYQLNASTKTTELESAKCEECNARSSVFLCSECSLRLCFNCTDAIHIIPSLAFHTIQCIQELNRIDQDDNAPPDDSGVGDFITHHSSSLPPPPTTTTTPIFTKTPELVVAPLALSPRFQSFNPTTQIENRASLPIGMHIFFRSPDCSRWSKELLHGTIIHDNQVHANASSKFYYRLVWLRGVETLPNGFFRASLDLTFPSPPMISYWPLEIGTFPTQLAAFRAVITAEQIARMKFRREMMSGRFVSHHFPSSAILDEILDETEMILGNEFRVRLTKDHDQQFLKEISMGKWDFREWMKSIGRDEHLKEEDAVMYESVAQANGRQNSHSTIMIPWQPSRRICFFLIEQRDLLLPNQIRAHHLQSILQQLLFVYIGYAWKKWRRFVKRSRYRELLLKRHTSASKLQRWFRRLQRQWLYGALGGTKNSYTSSLEALELYRRRQEEAVKLYAFMTRQYQAKQRRALRRWSDNVGINEPRVRRHFEVHEQTQWHPSHGITGLPKLPKIYARKRVDGGFTVDDMKMYKQFRANHTGPTDVSYWIIRGRVLAGTYPIGKSFSEARRIVARADYTTSVLLQEIGVFISLTGTEEFQAYEREYVAPIINNSSEKKSTATAKTKSPPSIAPVVSPKSFNQTSIDKMTIPWLFERVVRNKHEALLQELNTTVKQSLRQVELAEADLEQVPINESNDVSLDREQLVNKVILAKQNADKARSMLEKMTIPLRFLHFPISKDSVPDEQALEKFLVEIEDLLRHQQNLYIFSTNGHGRTGFLAALLLGRLYGIPASEALERAQRLHDCQWAMHNVPSTRWISSPKASIQVSMVQHVLARMNAIYVPVVNENSAQGFRMLRAQQRGVTVDPFLSKEGFMISEKPDQVTQELQAQEYKRLQYISKRESAAAQLQMQRRRELAERQAMEDNENQQIMRQQQKDSESSLMTTAKGTTQDESDIALECNLIMAELLERIARSIEEDKDSKV